ncbi:MAG: ABC transporter substrate-binding protein [Parvularculales bacterium]
MKTNTPKSLFLSSQMQKLKSGQISRRDFMSAALATGLTVPVALGMAGEAMAMTPKKGGSIVFGFGSGSTTDTLDPATYEANFNTNCGYMWGNNLVEVDETGNLIPELATEFSSDDAKTWVFTIRKGVEFHNGKTLTPDDVVASIEHHRKEGSKSAVGGTLSQIGSIRADGNNVVFELNAANADFPFVISDYHLLIMPSEGGEIVDPQSGVGTGGYIIDVYEPGVRFKGRRNPNYFKSDRAHFDEIEGLAIIDPNARQTALLNGSVHAIDRVDPKTVALLSRASNVKIAEKASTTHYTMPMRVDAAPFDNYDLRMALKLSVKRQELVDKILLGHGSLGNDHPISPADRFFDASLPQREYDPDRAASHYKKSGHSGTIMLSSSDAAFAGAVDAAQLIAASAREVGIDIEVVREPSDGYWSNVWNKKPWCTCFWSGRPTADWSFSAAYTNDTEWNDTAWRTGKAPDRFNAIIIEARAELDDNKRRKLYAEATMLLHDDGGALIPMFANHLMGLSKTISHGEIAANWELDGAKAAERWWIS